jgi:predicted nucleic-acid-binding protein
MTISGGGVDDLKPVRLTGSMISYIPGRRPSNALDVIQSILRQQGISVADRALVEEAITRARQAGREFPDAYICALADAGHCDRVATFNEKHFRALEAELQAL